MKVVINADYGGFGLSPKAVRRYAEIKGINVYPFTAPLHSNKHIQISWEQAEKECFLLYSTKQIVGDKCDKDSYFSEMNIPRHDKALIQVIQELGEKANGNFAKLEIIEIPDDVDYVIEEYDGAEWIAEKHRTWGA